MARVLCVFALLAGLSTAQADIETLYVIQMSHADVGFNAPPLTMQQRNHDRTVAALNVADQRPAFRWTIETTYQLEGFVDRASQSDINRLRTLLQNGRFTYGANYTNLHSGLCGEAEYNRLVDPAIEFAKVLGVNANTALLDDVPGFTTATPRVLADHGIPYAVLGPNDFIGGKPDIPLNERVFWWQGRDGSRVLSWMAYGSYIEGYFDWGLSNITNARIWIPQRVAEFEDAGYPFDAVMVLRAADDEFPTTAMVDLANEWNASESIQIKLATPSEFFEYILNTYGDVFPTYEGDASGMWESVSMVTPATHARVRRARSMLPDVEAMWQAIADAGGGEAPVTEILEAYKLAMVFNEHAGGGMGWPGLLTEEEIREENEQFVAGALLCQARTEKLRDRALKRAAGAVADPVEPELVVFNPRGEAFDGVLVVDAPGGLPSDLRLVDPDGGPDATFRWLNDERASLAIDAAVAVGEWERWRLESGGDTPPPPAWVETDRISAGPLELVLESNMGTALSLIDSERGIDWLAQPGVHAFGGIEQATNLEAFVNVWREMNPRPVTLRAETDPVALFKRIQVLDARGSVIREYRLYESERRMDVRITVRTSDLPFVPYEDHSHHYMVAFPMNLALPTTFHISSPDGWVQPGVESLPGSALGHFGTSTGARLVGSNGRWTSITSCDSPMVDLGEMTEGAVETIETDEYGMGWKLRRHADLSEVRGGARVPMEAEPGMPDATEYVFVIRFGEANDTPPTLERMRRDISPPFATWVNLR